MIDHGPEIFGCTAGAAQFLETFKAFPPSQRAGSFSIDQAVEKLKTGLGSK